MMPAIDISLTGIDKVIAGLSQFPRRARVYMRLAGREAAWKIILKTEGLEKYPLKTKANLPPTPYYIRGRGMQRAGRRKPEYNDGSSERLGTQWYVKTTAAYTEMGNRASYAPHVHGPGQAKHMAAIGWRKLVDVGKEKVVGITRVYQAWVNKLIRDLGL